MRVICEMDAGIEHIKRDIAELKERHDYSQADVARLVGVNPPHLSNIIAGNVTPTRHTRERMEQKIAAELKRLNSGGASSIEELPRFLDWFRWLESRNISVERIARVWVLAREKLPNLKRLS